jgi:hypothetical protein
VLSKHRIGVRSLSDAVLASISLGRGVRLKVWNYWKQMLTNVTDRDQFREYNNTKTDAMTTGSVCMSNVSANFTVTIITV